MTHLHHTSPLRIVLASQSAARLATLQAAGIHPEVHVSTVDEDAVLALLDTADFRCSVKALAEAKARDVATRRNIAGSTDPMMVVGADSMLEIHGQLVGKPHTPQVATARWKQMRGSTGVLHTGHCVILNPAAQRLAGPTSPSTTTSTTTTTVATQGIQHRLPPRRRLPGQVQGAGLSVRRLPSRRRRRRARGLPRLPRGHAARRGVERLGDRRVAALRRVAAHRLGRAPPRALRVKVPEPARRRREGRARRRPRPRLAVDRPDHRGGAPARRRRRRTARGPAPRGPGAPRRRLRRGPPPP